MRMLRNWKAWGVLGLLLALVVASGYEQAPAASKNPWVLTSTHTLEFNNKLSLFIIDLDIHPWRHAQYQATQSPPGNVWPGIAYFLHGWPNTVPPFYGGALQLYLSDLSGLSLTSKLCFRRFPQQTPRLDITADASFPLPPWRWVGPITATPPNCQCIEGPTLDVPGRNQTEWVKWTFRIWDAGMEFCRLEVGLRRPPK
jgi:hypothetical protein